MGKLPYLQAMQGRQAIIWVCLLAGCAQRRQLPVSHAVLNPAIYKVTEASTKPALGAAFRPLQVKVYRKRDSLLVSQYVSCENGLGYSGIFKTWPPRNLNPVTPAPLSRQLNGIQLKGQPLYTLSGKPYITFLYEADSIGWIGHVVRKGAYKRIKKRWTDSTDIVIVNFDSALL